MKFAIAVLSLIFTILLIIAGYYFGLDVSWQNLATKFGIAVTAAVVFGSLYTKVFSPLVGQFRSMSALLDEVNKIVTLHQHVDFPELVVNVREILADLKPNSGTSLRDAVNRIEARLMQMEGVQGALRQDGPVAIFRCSVSGANLEVNRTYCRWLGCTEKDLLGFGWKNFVHDDGSSYEQVWTVAFSEGRELEWRLTLQDYEGEMFWVDLHAYPIVNQDGDVVEYLGILHKTDEKESRNTDENN